MIAKGSRPDLPFAGSVREALLNQYVRTVGVTAKASALFGCLILAKAVCFNPDEKAEADPKGYRKDDGIFIHWGPINLARK